jgi:peptide/nickel transport system substrate-binding protein
MAPNKNSQVATGPCQFVDWDGATRLDIRRFPHYKPNTAYPGRDGYGGRRTAYFDEVTFKVVSERSSRVAGLQTGQFTVIDDVAVPAAKRLAGNHDFRVYDRMPISINVVPVNVSNPPTDNILVRRAIQQVINDEEAMAVATDGAFRLNPSFIYPDNAFYPKDASKLVYNAKNAEKAKALLKEAGYKGEELVILTSSDIASLKEVAVVVGEQLKSIGMKVRIDVLDWPAANARRNDPKTHNLFSTSYAIQPLLGPFQYQRLVSGPGNWSFYKEDKVMDDAWRRLLAATTDADRSKAWQDIEFRMNEEVYQLKIGDRGIKQVATARLQNFKTFDAIRMWDVWLA